MMDLLGSDLPVESDEGMKFSWSDGILLQVEFSCDETYHALLWLSSVLLIHISL